ncbi:MAG: putative endonuclease [Planctomycetota bacterium]
MARDRYGIAGKATDLRRQRRPQPEHVDSLGLWARLQRRYRAWLIRHRPLAGSRLPELSRSEVGTIGEELAARWLRRHGFKLLARRLRTPACEVDILAQQRRQLVIIEVKSSRWPRHPKAPWRPGDRLSWRQRERLERAAAWLQPRKDTIESPSVRIDLVEVWLAQGEAAPEFQHHASVARRAN